MPPRRHAKRPCLAASPLEPLPAQLFEHPGQAIVGGFGRSIQLLMLVEPSILGAHRAGRAAFDAGAAGLLTTVIFGCGLVGAIAQRVIVGRTRSYAACTRVCFGFLAPAWITAAAGWYWDLPALIWPGLFRRRSLWPRPTTTGGRYGN